MPPCCASLQKSVAVSRNIAEKTIPMLWGGGSVGTISVTIDDGLLVEFLDSKWWELWVVPLWWTRLVCGCGKIDNVKILT